MLLKKARKITKNLKIMSGAFGAGLTALTNIGMGLINNDNNRKMQRNAFHQQMALNQQGKDLALQQWKDTNYRAQVNELKKAGLSTGLIYGQGGQGGTTATGSGGSAPSYSESKLSLGIEPTTIAQLELMKAQKDNIEANTNKTNIEASNITDPILTDIAKKNAERDATLIQNDINRDTVKEQKEQIASESVLKRNEALVSTNSINENIKLLHATRIGRELENALTEVKKDATAQEILNMKQAVRKMQAEIQQNWKSLDQKEREIYIKKLEQELKAMYPALGQVWGGKINEALRDIDEMLEQEGGNYHGQKR